MKSCLLCICCERHIFDLLEEKLLYIPIYIGVEDTYVLSLEYIFFSVCQMLKVRRMLTEILIGVTDEEITLVAQDVYAREKTRAAKGINQCNTGVIKATNIHVDICSEAPKHCYVDTRTTKYELLIVTYLDILMKSYLCLSINKTSSPNDSDLNLYEFYQIISIFSWGVNYISETQLLCILP